MRKWHTKRAVPLDVVPKRRTKRCSPRFRPGGRFGAKFQIPVARQGGREVSAPRPYVTDPTHSLGSIHNYEQFLYICNNVPFISSMWYLHCILVRYIFDNCACAHTETLISKFRAIINVFLYSIRNVLVHLVRHKLWLSEIQNSNV